MIPVNDSINDTINDTVNDKCPKEGFSIPFSTIKKIAL